MRRLLIGLAAAGILLVPSTAQAEVTLKKSIWGPIDRHGVSQFPIYAELGVGLFQITVPWHQVAPTKPANPRDPRDPAYRWTPEVDAAIQQGARHGIEVSVMILGAPGWSNGGRDWRWAPRKTSDFADFVEAAARRWPAVRHWMIWSEPTKAQNFQPLEADNGRPLRGRKLRGPRKYARMLDAAYGRLKRVSRRNLVIGGNTFTVGTVRPRYFLPALRLPNGKPPRMDMFGHNPFSNREPDLRKPPLGQGYADFSDLDTLARWIDRYVGRKPGGGRLRLFLSEISFPTDHANFEFNFFLTREAQARWITSALRITRSWSRIYTFGYLGLFDDAPRVANDQVERGLIEYDGDRKPGFEAFKAG